MYNGNNLFFNGRNGGLFIFKKRFFFNVIVLSVTSFIAYLISMGFRIYLSDCIGTEGIGLYQLITSIFVFFATITTAGMNLTATRLSTELISKGQFGKARRCVALCVLLSVTTGIVGGGLLFFGADFIALRLLNDTRTALSLKILAPALPFMAVSSCFRGFFFARRNALKTSSEKLLEQFIEIGTFAAVITFFAGKDIEYACCSICIGTLAAEILSCLYSFILYRLDIRKTKSASVPVRWFLKSTAEIALPVTANSCLRTGLSAVENILIPFGLKKNGLNYTKALSDYGIITGMAMPVLMFPSVLITPFSSLIIPEVAQAHTNGKIQSIRNMTQSLFRGVLFYSLPITVILMFFSSEFGQVIYGNTEVGVYIGILAPIIPFVYLDSITDAILKGINEQLSYLIFNFIDSAIRVVLTYVLLPLIGIKGVIIVIFVSELLNTVMSIARLLKVTQIKFMIFEWVIKPILFTALPCAFIKTLNFPTTGILDLCIRIALCTVFYLLLLFAFSKHDDSLKILFSQKKKRENL
ncbi:MAG: oligosaccharide flippase family protein [Acutalibacteraceae bacterium]